MKKYSIEEINDDELNIVCRVNDVQVFNRLIQICPNMCYYYDEKCNHYLLPRCGRGDEYSYGSNYTIIDVCNIDGFDDPSYVFKFDNGIPVIWDYDVFC